VAYINNSENVKKQFQNAENLSYRISFYKKYDSAPCDFSDWIFEKYGLSNGDRVLELGCGDGCHWEKRIEKLPEGCTIILSDISDGMISEVKKRIHHKKVTTEVIDVQSIPYDNDYFDVVIANHMLFHVPDLEKAMFEIQRVLKPAGTFYAATDSNEGIRPYLHSVLKLFDASNDAFTEKISFSVENGCDLLKKYFRHIDKYEYDYPLVVTNTSDLMRWLLSTTGISGYSYEYFDELYSYFEKIRIINGSILIPKKSGMFVSIK